MKAGLETQGAVGTDRVTELGGEGRDECDCLLDGKDSSGAAEKSQAFGFWRASIPARRSPAHSPTAGVPLHSQARQLAQHGRNRAAIGLPHLDMRPCLTIFPIPPIGSQLAH